MRAKKPRFQVKVTMHKQWMVVLVAANGEFLMWSECYTRRADALRALKAIRAAARTDRVAVGARRSRS